MTLIFFLMSYTTHNITHISRLVTNCASFDYNSIRNIDALITPMSSSCSTRYNDPRVC